MTLKNTQLLGRDMDINGSQVASLLEALIERESPSGKEHDAVRHVERMLADLSIPVRVQKVRDRANVISSVGATRQPLLLLCSHIDTVPASGSHAPSAERHMGRFYGLGASDAKGSVVAMTLAYRELLNLGFGRAVTLTFFVGEEETGDGGITFVRRGYRPKYAIVGEPTNLSLPWAQAGYLHLTLTATCTPRHAFSMHGRDAITLVMDAISSIKALLTRLSKGLPWREKPDIFFQHIEGGSPDKFWYLRHNCSTSMIINVHPQWDVQEVISRIKVAVNRNNLGNAGAHIRVKVESWDPGFEFSSKVLRDAMTRAMRLNNLQVRPTYMRSWTDAATLMWKNVQTVVIGPGSLQHAHSPEDSVLFQDIMKAARVYRDSALELMRRESGGTAD